MDFSFVLNNPVMQNPIVSGIMGVAFTSLGVGAWIAKWFRTSKYKAALDKGTESAGNLAGLRMKGIIDAVVKDEAIKKELLQELTEAPDNFNRGYDRGLNGLKYGDPEYNLFAGN